MRPAAKRSPGRPPKNIDGAQFGLLTVLKTRVAERGPGASRALVRCGCCGKEFEVRRVNLKRGRVKSCGSLARQQSAKLGQASGGQNRLTLTGQTFGKLRAIEPAPNRDGATRWLCACDCGQQKAVKTAHLRSGATKSCGCLQQRTRSEWLEREGARLFNRAEQQETAEDWRSRRLQALRLANRRRPKCGHCADWAHYTWLGRAYCREHLPAKGRERLSAEWQMARLLLWLETETRKAG
jgi:hypothetical protein